jgi:hypothetical protein
MSEKFNKTPGMHDMGIVTERKRPRQCKRIYQESRLPICLTAVDANECSELIIPESSLRDHQAHHPIRHEVLDADILPGRVYRPVGLIVRSEEEAFDRFTANPMSVCLDRFGFSTPDKSARARVVIDTEGVPVHSALARGDVGFDCVEGAVAAEFGLDVVVVAYYRNLGAFVSFSFYVCLFTVRR